MMVKVGGFNIVNYIEIEAPLLGRLFWSLKPKLFLLFLAPGGAPAVAYSAGGPRLPDYSEAVDMETAKLQPV